MKMQTTEAGTVNAPAERIWATIAAGGDVHRWFGAFVTACEITGSGAGAERVCTMTNGAELKERILEIDERARSFRYAIVQHPLPARDVVATIEVTDLSEATAHVTWRAEYEAEEAEAALVDQTLSEVYAQGIRALENHCRLTA